MQTSTITWRDVVSHLCARFKVLRLADSTLSLTFASGATVLIMSPRPDRVELLVSVCDEQQLVPRTALALSRDLTLGALVLDGDGYVVRHLVPLSAGIDAVEQALAELVHASVRLRREIRGGWQGQPPEIFGYYAA